MFFGNFGLLQSSGKAGVVHVAERVGAAGDDAAGGRLHHGQALVVVPLVPSPDEGEQDDDDQLGGQEDDGPGDHAGLVQTVSLVDGGDVVQKRVLNPVVVRGVELARRQLRLLVLLPLAILVHDLEGLDHEHLLGAGGPLGPGQAHQG